MHQVSPHHPIGIHQQVVESLPAGRRAGDRLDRLVDVEDRNEAGVGAGLLAQALLLGPHAFVAVEVEADRHRTFLAEAPDRLAKQLVINRPAVSGDIEFTDADQAQWFRPQRPLGPEPAHQVVDLQIHRLGHQALAQSEQHQGGGCVGHQGPGPATQGRAARTTWPPTGQLNHHRKPAGPPTGSGFGRSAAPGTRSWCQVDGPVRLGQRDPGSAGGRLLLGRALAGWIGR